MRTRAASIALAISLLAPAILAGEAPPVAPSITPAELSARRAAGTAPVVIDVRTAEEYAVSHISDAVNIPFDRVADRISELDTPHGVVLYCMVGPRARKGEQALLAAGHPSVFHLEGGMAAWMAAGLPVERKQ